MGNLIGSKVARSSDLHTYGSRTTQLLVFSDRRPVDRKRENTTWVGRGWLYQALHSPLSLYISIHLCTTHELNAYTQYYCIPPMHSAPQWHTLPSANKTIGQGHCIARCKLQGRPALSGFIGSSGVHVSRCRYKRKMTGIPKQKHRPTLFCFSPSSSSSGQSSLSCSFPSARAILQAVVWNYWYSTDDKEFPALWSFARSAMLGALCPRLVV
jgi:hypothetical protein